MNTASLTIKNTLKKLRDRFAHSRGRTYIIKNMQAIDWISDSLISAGANIVKDKSSNSYTHEENSI